MTCVIHEGGYCPGCLTRYDARFYAVEGVSDLIGTVEAIGTWAMTVMEQEHEDRCVPYQMHRVMDSLRFFARLDAVRAPGSW